MEKRKKLTNAQKKENAEFKKRLQREGIIPPDKPRLNRKKFVEEARNEWNNRESEAFIWDLYLQEAVSLIISDKDRYGKVTLEAVGVAKCLKLAVRLKEFRDKIKAEGRDTYTMHELYEYIKDILNA